MTAPDAVVDPAGQDNDSHAQSLPADESQANSSSEEKRTFPWDDPESAKAEIEKLRKESAKHRSRNRELEPLASKWKEKEDSEKTDLQRMSEELEALRGTSAKLEANNNRLMVAAEFNLDADFMPLLNGDSDQMRATAELISRKLRSPSPGPAGSSRPVAALKPGVIANTDKPVDNNDAIRRLFHSKYNERQPFGVSPFLGGAKMPYDTIVTRDDPTTPDPFIPDTIVNEVIQTFPQQSAVMNMARHVPMSAKKTRQPVLSVSPDAYWVNGDDGLKRPPKRRGKT